MPEKAWKRAERATAHLLGGERTPLSGSNSRHTKADAIDVWEYVEHKHRKQDPAHEQLSKLTKAARRRDRWPAIVYELVNDDGLRARWVALWLERYAELREDEDRTWLQTIGPREPWMLTHEIGKRLPHGQLVLDTVDEAWSEGRPPLVVVSRHRSPNRVALVPLKVGSP